MEIKKKYIYILVAILVVLLLSASQYFARERGKEYFKQFNEAKIDNVLKVDSYIFAKGSGIKLENGLEYVFYPYTNRKLNEGKNFNRVAKKGDKIFKEPYSDTLFLFKKNKILKYTFIKF